MPRYTIPPEELLSEEDVRKLYNIAKTPAEIVLICLLWMTGGRPSEILEIRCENTVIEDTWISFKIPTLKLHSDGQHFLIKERTLRFKRPPKPNHNIYIESIVNYVTRIQKGKLLDYGRSWMDKKINQMGMDAIGKQISPYHFRHSAVTRELTNGRDLSQAQHFKGSKDIRSVIPYAHARPYEVNLEYGDVPISCAICGKSAAVLSSGECEACFRKKYEKAL